MMSPHGIPADLLDRLLVIKTGPYTVDEIRRIVHTRALTEVVPPLRPLLQGNLGRSTGGVREKDTIVTGCHVGTICFGARTLCCRGNQNLRNKSSHQPLDLYGYVVYALCKNGLWIQRLFVFVNDVFFQKGKTFGFQEGNDTMFNPNQNCNTTLQYVSASFLFFILL